MGFSSVQAAHQTAQQTQQHTLAAGQQAALQAALQEMQQSQAQAHDSASQGLGQPKSQEQALQPQQAKEAQPGPAVVPAPEQEAQQLAAQQQPHSLQVGTTDVIVPFSRATELLVGCDCCVEWKLIAQSTGRICRGET